jgi:uncharacterized protein YjbI with pentapeptide repeats
MVEPTLDQRLAEKRELRQQDSFVLGLLGGGVAMAFGVWLGNSLYGAGGSPLADTSGYWSNIYAELIGFTVTVIVLNALFQNRQAAFERRRYQKQLLREVRGNNATARAAVEALRDEEWLVGEEGLLKDAQLRECNLSNAHLQNTNLAGATLTDAELRGARLEGADLTGVALRRANLAGATLSNAQLNDATLIDANLAGATLRDADLTHATLRLAKFGGADLRRANFTDTTCVRADFAGASCVSVNFADADLSSVNFGGANLSGSHLSGATLRDTQFDERTVLPDAVYLGNDAIGQAKFDRYWTASTDMTRYTDPNHPDFWSPEGKQ